MATSCGLWAPFMDSQLRRTENKWRREREGAHSSVERARSCVRSSKLLSFSQSIINHHHYQSINSCVSFQSCLLSNSYTWNHKFKEVMRKKQSRGHQIMPFSMQNADFTPNDLFHLLLSARLQRDGAGHRYCSSQLLCGLFWALSFFCDQRIYCPCRNEVMQWIKRFVTSC